MPKIRLDLTDIWLHFRFGRLRETVDLAERLLKAELDEYSGWLDKEAEGLTAEQREEFYALNLDDYWQLRDQYPSLMRRALFLVCYTEWEAYLGWLCDSVSRRKNLSLSVDELSGSTIDRIKKYLSKVADIEFPPEGAEWQAFTDYRKLRNLLAHTDARLTKQKRHNYLRRYVNRHPCLELDPRGFILIRQGFCEEVIDTATQLFKKLPKELRQ